MSVNLDAVRAAIVSPELEISLVNEERAVVAQTVLLSEPNGYFADNRRYLKWSYLGLLRYVFADLCQEYGAQGIDIVDHIYDASYYSRLHESTQEGIVRLVVADEVQPLLELDMYRPRHEALLARLRAQPLPMSYIGSKGTPPEAVTGILKYCLNLPPEERGIVKWMATAYDSPVMQLITRFGYMSEGRRRMLANILADPLELEQFQPRGDRTTRQFIQLYRSLCISPEERALLIYIGRSEHLANLGRRIVRIPDDRRVVITRML